MSAFSPVYFADENALGMAKILARSGRTDFLYPGHPNLPEVPLGALDLDWMPIVGGRGFIAITRDRRIRTRPAELEAYITHGIRSVWIGAKQDLRSDEQADLFLKHEERLRREVVKRGDGPWALAMNSAAAFVNAVKTVLRVAALSLDKLSACAPLPRSMTSKTGSTHHE